MKIGLVALSHFFLSFRVLSLSLSLFFSPGLFSLFLFLPPPTLFSFIFNYCYLFISHFCM